MYTAYIIEMDSNARYIQKFMTANISHCLLVPAQSCQLSRTRSLHHQPEGTVGCHGKACCYRDGLQILWVEELN